MRLYSTTLPFLVSLASLCHGTPVGSPADTAELTRRDQYSFCATSSTYKNKVRGDSPLASDCQIMIDRIQGGGVYSIRLDDTPTQIMHYKTCHLNWKGKAEGSPTVNVGNKDIITYVQHVIDTMKSSAGRVGAYGYTKCRKVDAPNSSAGNMYSIRWGVY